MFSENSYDEKNKKKNSDGWQLPVEEPGLSRFDNGNLSLQGTGVQESASAPKSYFDESGDNGVPFEKPASLNTDFDISPSSPGDDNEKDDPLSPSERIKYEMEFMSDFERYSPFRYYDRTEPWKKYLKRVNPDYTDAGVFNIYATSQQAVDDIANDYYNNYLNKVYDACRKKQEQQIKEVMIANARNPIAAMRMAQYKNDPMKVIDNTMNGIDMDVLREMVSPLTDRIGIGSDEYIDKFIKPTLRNMMIRKYIDKNKPKSSFEYILRSINDRSLVGKIANIGMSNNSQVQLERESLAAYNASRLENFAAGVGGLLVDVPLFKGLGIMSNAVVGKATSMATNKLASRIFAYNAAEGMQLGYATRLAERMIRENLTTKIIQNAASSGLTLGGYDFANSIAEDILYNEGVDIDKAMSAFSKGALTGVTLGAVGTVLRGKTAGLTGGRKVVASAGVLTAESAVFTASTEIDKMLHGVVIEPIDIVNDFAEGVATLSVMKFVHSLPKGAAYKLDRKGQLKEKLQLSKSEQEELRELNMNPKEFMDMIENSLKYQPIGSGKTYYDVVEQYLDIMQSKNVSATTKSKLMYLIENKITSTPPLQFDYSVEKNEKGNWILTTYDFEGNKIERHVFEHAGNAKNYLLAHMGDFRKNRIAAYERELLQVYDSQNFLRQAGLYVQETGISVDEVSEALYKRAKKMELTPREKTIVREIVERTTYNETGMTQFLADMRREIERKHLLREGSMLDNIDISYYSCTKAENAALDEYEALVRNEANVLKKGTDPVRAAELEKLGRNSPFKGMSNEEVKKKEVLDFQTNYADNRNPNVLRLKEKMLEIDDAESDGTVWSYEGIDNTVEDLNKYKSYADNLAKKLNVDIEYIWDERDIPRPENGDKYDIANYNNKLRAMGWAEDGGKVVINLPNIASVEELEKTVVHEAVVHVGLTGLFGNHFHAFLEELYYKSTPAVRAGINDMKRNYKTKNNYLLIEEYLASLVEKNASTILDTPFYKEFKNFVKNSLVKMNLYTGRNRRVTEEELVNLLHQHAKYMSRKADPSKYRRWVFGVYEASRQDAGTYTDKKLYGDYIRGQIADGKFFKKTPNYLYNHRAFDNYEFMPEEMQTLFRKRWNATDEEVRRIKTGESYRLIDEDAASYGKEFGSSDMEALNSRLERKYNEAMSMVKSIEEARRLVPDFDKDGVLDKAFATDYQFTPDVFKNRFPSFDEYLIHKLSGSSVVPFNSYGEANAPAWHISDLKRFLTGPLDIVRDLKLRMNGWRHNGKR